MWWLYLIFALILMLYCVLFVIAYGIKFVLRLDVNNMSVCIKCYALDWIEVLCFKFFVCNGLFYYQINKKQLKTIGGKDKSENKTQQKRVKKKKLKTSAYLSKLWNKRPNIKIKKLNVNYGTTFEEIKDKVLFDGYTAIITNTLLAIGSEKIKLQDFELQNVSDQSKFNGVDIECVLGFSLFKIAAYAIYAMAVKKKYEIAV
ncbi:MAG: hypothetical protein K2K85_00615 [Clostridia bacterium]|nr:hypothetical protein [Clostridia bacterium]